MVAAKAVHDRHLAVHQHHVVALPPGPPQGQLRRCARSRLLQPRRRSMLPRHFLVRRVVLGQQDARRRCGPAVRSDWGCVPLQPAPGAHAVPTRAERDAVTGLRRQALTTGLARACRSAAECGERHQRQSRAAQRGSERPWHGQSDPVHPGQARVDAPPPRRRSPCRRGIAQRLQRLRAAPAAVQRCPTAQHLATEELRAFARCHRPPGRAAPRIAR